MLQNPRHTTIWTQESFGTEYGARGKGCERTKGACRRDVWAENRCADKEDCSLNLGRYIQRETRIRSSNVFSFSSPAKRTNNANTSTHYVKLLKKRLKSSERSHYIIFPRVTIKAVTIMLVLRHYRFIFIFTLILHLTSSWFCLNLLKFIIFID